MSASQNTRLRVGVHAALDPDAAGGVQTNLLSLVRGMASERDGVLLDLMSPPSLVARWREIADSSFGVSPFPFVFPWYREPAKASVAERLKGFGRDQLTALRQPWQAHIRAAGVDLVHFPYQLAFDVSVPSVYEPWDLQHLHLPQLFSPGERAWRTAMYQRACRRAAVVVTATAATKRDVVEAFGIPPERIAVVYRDSGLAVLTPPEADRRRVLERFAIGEPFAFYPAAAYPHKNHARVIEAFAALRDRHSLSPLLVLSGRPDAARDAEIDVAAAAQGLAGRVLRLGTVSEAELASLYAEARLMVFPSRFEGLGLPLLEAMQHGLPIVAAAASCIPEVVADAAELFDPDDPGAIADAIARCWQDDGLRHRLRENGLRRRRDFSWEQAAPRFRAVYRKAAARTLDAADVRLWEEAVA